ncbi:MAG: ATP-binding cassette domain-containing protein [Rhizobiaceae bacterium]|nr:ATP-binding cassette domain-containing protein [Rhizobiaceae bacterium]
MAGNEQVNTNANQPPLLETKGITKIFGELYANNSVDFAIQEGEIHALLGENGAGKSTLVKILFGSLQQSAGEVFWKGQEVHVKSPSEARALGIGMVFQHFSLFEALTVAENIALSFDAGVELSDVSEKARSLSAQYGLPLDPDALVGDLSVGQRQRIEIIRCLMQDPALIILDEPTSVLTPQEADTLFETLFRLREEGRSILYISHRLEEVQRLCSAATIMRHGEVVDSCDPREETAGSLASKMVGADVEGIEHKTAGKTGDVVLALNNLSMGTSHPFAVALKNISLEVRQGEVVCIAGIAGNGQGELFEAISGEDRQDDPNQVVIRGTDAGYMSISQRRNLGASFVPEERLGHGAVPEMSLTDNMLLARHASDASEFKKMGRLNVIAQSAIVAATKRVNEVMDVRKSAEDPPAGALSGGNLQKFIVGRELDRNPSFMLVNQPTWGVDAGAAAHIRQSLLNLAASGSAVLVISQDLDEIFEIATSIAVMADGHMFSPQPAADMNREKIGLLMASSGGNEGQAA